MTNLNKVVTSLQKEYSRLQKEIERVGKALDALGQLTEIGSETKRSSEQGSPSAYRRCAEATLGKSAETSCQASQVVRVFPASTAGGPRSSLPQHLAGGA